MNPRDRVRPPEPLPGDDVGGYVLKALLGRGGFGTVYLAERGGHRYALKLLPLARLGDSGERELLMLARVKHPNVVRLLGYWQWPDGAPGFLVVIMEYVEGLQLDVWADTENPSARGVLQRLRGVARALRALHEGKALHRDVKEANILVREADGEAVLVDLGVGSHEDATPSTGGSLPPGTRAYLSPEAWRFHREHRGRPGARYRSTPADDLYAVGVVLYWLLTGRRPFQLEEHGDEAAVISRTPVAPHVRNGRVPEELGALCLRLLEKRPEHRPDASALLATLEDLLTRDGPEWHVPLCDFHDAHNVTTRPGPDANEEAAWLNEVRDDLPPRRGRRPPRLAKELEEPDTGASISDAPLPLHASTPSPAPATEACLPPEAPTLMPVPVAVEGFPAGASPRAQLPRAPRAAALVGLLAMLSVAVAYRAATPPPSFDGGAEADDPGRKVAPPATRPESSGAAAPPGAVTLPAAIAPSPKEPAPVTTQNNTGTLQPSSPAASRRVGSGRTLKLAVTACGLLGCSGAQVREKPPPEPCPPGAIEAMEALGIDVGDEAAWSYKGKGGNRVLTVSEGWTSVFLIGRDFGDIPNNSLLSGRLVFGDRVYGRLTQVQFEGTGRTVPVCMELLDTESERGLKLEDGSSPTRARVFSTGFLKAVKSFE